MNNTLKRLFAKVEVPQNMFHLFYVIQYMAFLALLVHASFILVFHFLNVPYMFYFNFGSCLVFLICIIFCRKGRLDWAFAIVVLEVLSHAVLSVRFVGWDSGFHIYLFCLIPLMFFLPSWSMRSKISFSLLMSGVYIFLNILTPDAGKVAVSQGMLSIVRYYNFFAACIFLGATSFYYGLASRKAENRLRAQYQELEEAKNLIQEKANAIKMTMMALQESEEIFRTVVTNSEPHIFCINLDMKFTLSEGKALRSLGLKARQLVGRSVREVFRDSPEVIESIKASQGGKTSSHLSVPLRGSQGTVYFEVFFSPQKNEEGNIVGTIGIANDISERIAAERENARLRDQLQRAEKMEAIGTLAGGVAHDLNNVLAGIVGYPDMMLMDMEEDHPLRSSLEIIKESGQKAAQIVQDLLTLARRGVSVREVLDLNKIISDYLRSPEYQKIKSAFLEVKVRSELGEELANVLGSPVHLSKTVMNLVSNALEAMPDGGDLLVKTENCYIDKSVGGYEHIGEGEYVLLSITDTGIGISKEDQTRIFEPFYTKKVMGRSGTGLGMAVVWGTIKDHNGYIDVKSKEGQGTTFNIYFPVTNQEKEEKVGNLPFDVEKFKVPDKKILVVDDLASQRDIATKMLTKLEYAVNSVASEEEALEFLRTHKVDIVILDMVLAAGADGLNVYKQIKAEHEQQKVIIASGYSDTQKIKEAENLGVKSYLKKPFTFEQLAKVVKQELSRTE